MALDKESPPTGRTVTLELNEFEASTLCGSLAVYRNEMIKNIALTAAIKGPEKALAVTREFKDQMELVERVIKGMDEDYTYKSADFSAEYVQKQRDDFSKASEHMSFILSDGTEGTAPPDFVAPSIPLPEGEHPSTTDGKVTSMTAFRKKRLH